MLSTELYEIRTTDSLGTFSIIQPICNGFANQIIHWLFLPVNFYFGNLKLILILDFFLLNVPVPVYLSMLLSIYEVFSNLNLHGEGTKEEIRRDTENDCHF